MYYVPNIPAIDTSTMVTAYFSGANLFSSILFYIIILFNIIVILFYIIDYCMIIFYSNPCFGVFGLL